MASNDVSGLCFKPISDLRVIDLKIQLEKRDLDKTGVKAVLIERLTRALQDEGHNVDEFLFEVNETTPLKKPVSVKRPDEAIMNENEARDEVESNGVELADNYGNVEANLSRESDTKSAYYSKGSEDFAMETDEHVRINQGSMKEDSEAGVGGADTEPLLLTEMRSKRNSGGDQAADGASSSIVPRAPGTPTREEAPWHGDGAKMEGGGEDDGGPIVQLDDNQDEFDADLIESVKSAEDLAEEAKSGGDGSGGTQKDGVAVSGLKTEASDAPGAASDAATKKVDDKKDTGKGKSASSASLDGKASPKDSAKPAKPSVSHSRNLWVSGLSSTTRATDLKTLFGKYGKVIGAKVVANARRPGSRCYGFVTMSNSEDATKCIHHLHRTEMHGRMISVEKTSNDPASKTFARRPAVPKKDDKKPDAKKMDAKRPLPKREEKPVKKEESEKTDVDKNKSPEEKAEVVAEDKSTEKATPKTELKPAHSDKEILSLEKIKAARERERLRRQQHNLREQEKRCMMMMRRDRIVQRNNARKNEEAQLKLDREKRLLKLEREKLDREKYEYERQARLRLEQEQREHAKFEREKRELERNMQEFKVLMEAQRNAMKRPMEREERTWEAKRPAAYAVSRDRASTRAAGGASSTGSGAFIERRVEKTRGGETIRRDRKSAERRRSDGFDASHHTTSRDDTRRRESDVGVRSRSRDDASRRTERDASPWRAEPRARQGLLGNHPPRTRGETWDDDRKADSGNWTSTSALPSWAGQLGQSDQRAALAMASALLPNPSYLNSAASMMIGQGSRPHDSRFERSLGGGPSGSRRF